jgi:lipopolysaccharide/colanic/teichoic acid biosynthesis glycosyltransferase
MSAARTPGTDRATRALDLVAAGLLLAVTAPVTAVVAIAVRRSMGSPVLFRQVRAGRGGKPFTIYKFRTMRDAHGPDGEPLADEERVTRVGDLLRSWSLDEIPQLINVLRGEMAMVGPRPLYLDYIPLYSPEQARRLQVRPGVTGLVQVGGRNALSWEEKFALDVRYVDERSLGLDLRILAMTAWRVLQRSGIRTEGFATAPWFTGSAAATTAGTQERD